MNDRNTNYTRGGRNFNSIRTLMAASLAGDTMILATLPVSGRQLDEIVQYDRSLSSVTGNRDGKSKVIVLDFTKIEGGLEQVLTSDAAVTLFKNLLAKAIKASGMEITSINIDEINTLLSTQIKSICEDNDTVKVETIVTAIRNARVSRSFGKWSQIGSVPVNRFIASVVGWTKGVNWVNANMSFAKTTFARPKYAIACYGYDAELLTQTGQPHSVAIPTAEPMAVCVLGFYPNAQGGYDIRYVGTMPAKPMISDQMTAAPLFIRHDAGSIATRKMADVIKAGKGNANELFQNPDNAGYFIFTHEMLTMSRRNPQAFVINFALAVAHTNGHKDVVKNLLSARAALNSATSSVQEILAKDYSSSTTRKTTGSPFASAYGSGNRTPQVVERELVGAGVGSAPSFGSTPSLDSAFSLEG